MDWKKEYYEELYHHGMKGMKWGVRKYQNKDGTLTPLGKQRYAQETLDSTQGKLKKREVTETNAKRKLEKAGDAYNKVKKTGTKEEIASAKEALDKAQSKYDKAHTSAENARTKNKNAKDDLQKANQELNNYKNRLNTVRNEANNISNATNNVARGTSNLIDMGITARNNKAKRNSNAHTMSDAELQKAINRMNMEQTYNRLMYDNRTSRGAEVAKSILRGFGETVAVVGGVVAIATGIKQLRT